MKKKKRCEFEPFSFALRRFASPIITRATLNQSNATPKLIANWSSTFSRASVTGMQSKKQANWLIVKFCFAQSIILNNFFS